MIRNKEILPEVNNAFKECKLDRKKYADILTEIILANEEGFVLAINNKWGTGKTTFIRMWQQDLIDNEFQTIYFNAWENDFENNALTALMGEFKTLVNNDNEQYFKNILKSGAILTKNILPTLVNSISEKYIGKDMNELVQNITKGVADIFENEVNEYANKKTSINIFKKNLSDFISDLNEGKPVVIFIDELDRCRPNYAVSILEQIKHFFSISNIVFVLSIDKEQLGHAVRGVYGSENINSDEYLRRFIDIEFSIPEPNTENFVKYLYDIYDFGGFFENPKRLSHRNNYLFRNEISNFIDTSIFLFNKSKLTLRQQEKVFSTTRLVLKSFPSNYFVYPQLFVFLAYTKVIEPVFFSKIKNKEISIGELQQMYVKQINHSESSLNDDRIIVYFESVIVYYYNEYKNNQSDYLFKYDSITQKSELLIDSLTDKSDNQDDFLNNLVYLERNDNNGGNFFINLMDKIDLLNRFEE